MKFIWLFVAGGCGVLARYVLGGWIQRACTTSFPMGTLAVNLLGCVVFGFVWALAEKLVISGETRFIILTGFVGAFTTFSTFAFETSELLRDSELAALAVNIFAHQVLGIIGVVAGITLGKLC